MQFFKKNKLDIKNEIVLMVQIRAVSILVLFNKPMIEAFKLFDCEKCCRINLLKYHLTQDQFRLHHDSLMS